MGRRSISRTSRPPRRGLSFLDELDASLIAIEMQITAFHAGADVRDSDWLRRVNFIVMCKRRLRPRLQQRISVLRKAERAAQPVFDQPNSPKDGQRRAFLLAAEAILDRELLTEVWARAQEMRPQAFGESGVVMSTLTSPIHIGTLNGKPLRFFKAPLSGPHLPWHAWDDMVACIGLPRSLRRHMQQSLKSEHAANIRTVATARRYCHHRPALDGPGLPRIDY